MFWRLKTLLAKFEPTYGVDSGPTGAANAILAMDVKIMPMKGSEEKRDYDRPVFFAPQSIPVGVHASISFKVEAKSRTPGTASLYGPLIRACRNIQVVSAGVSVAYTPHSGPQESATIYLNIDGTLHAFLGARGTWRYVVEAKAVPYFEFEMTGLFVQPISDVMPTVSFGSQLTQAPQAASTANTPSCTYGGVALILRSLTMDFGNTVVPRFLINSESILITESAESIDLTIEAVPLATFNPYALAAAAGTAPLVLVHGTGAGKICTLSVPAAQLMRPEGLEGQDGVVEWKLKMTPTAPAGNDQYSITMT